MDRITREELEQLKREVPVARLVRRRGVFLEEHGGNLVGRCPFHEGAAEERSLIVRPSTNTWECRGACQTRGSVIDWAMSAEKLGLRGAVEVLRDELCMMRCEAEEDADLPDYLRPLSASHEEPVPDLASLPQPIPSSAPSPAAEPDELVIEREDRRYRVRGLARNRGKEQLRVSLQVRRGTAVFLDTVDLAQARQRGAYLRQAATELGVGEELIKADLAEVIEQLEAKRQDPAPTATATMSDETRAEAMALLCDRGLVQRVVEAFAQSGMVGEQMNALAAYLVVTSRLLERPLAAVVQSSSSAGKTSLLDAVLAFVPDEDRLKLSAMTGQSLFYMGDTNLRHKVLALVEEEGARRASYALKLLQSEGELMLAVPLKDPVTGDISTQQKKVEGPVALMMATTAIDVGEELMNRCIVLAVNEGREQTQAIHRVQREARTLRGLIQKAERDRVLALHRNAQRLLRPLAVVNEYAPALRFVDGRTRTRRDHAKYLTLIDTIALLHQHQRPIRTVEVAGKVIEYIEVVAADVRLANELANEVLGRSLDELPPQTRRVLDTVHQWALKRCQAEGLTPPELRFTRRDVRELLGVSGEQVRVHIDRLVELEYVYAHRGRTGQSFVYELCYDGQGTDGSRFVLGLIDPDAPATSPNLQGLDLDLQGVDGRLPPPNRPRTGPEQVGHRGGSMNGSGLKTRNGARSNGIASHPYTGTHENGIGQAG